MVRRLTAGGKWIRTSGFRVRCKTTLSRPSRNQTGISNALHARPYGLFLDDLPIHIRPDLPAARVQT